MLCTRRGGIVSQVGYLRKQDPGTFDVERFLGVLIDRQVVVLRWDYPAPGPLLGIRPH
jgi:hypothetical protein